MLQQLTDGQPKSGADLARALGVTRAAVWKRIEALRQRGLPITGQAGRGYALPWSLELLDEGRIRAALGSATCAQLGQLQLLWEPQSTSTEVRTRSLPDGSFVLAEGQRDGRGRRGRTWSSPPGLNIYLSCIKRFDASMAALSGLSLAVGVMLMRALADVGVHEVGLKWPNDVLGGATSAAAGAKCAGVL
ncbi:MAG: HTH domain-containing protein, partial [Xanthomonadales bacterium]|nr:HTH domain-containing protein [Xanthomonadales bacterium]